MAMAKKKRAPLSAVIAGCAALIFLVGKINLH